MSRRRPPEEEPLPRLLRHRYGGLVEELGEEPSFVTRPMFGCLACYLHGRLKVVLADGKHPWDGLLLPTSRDHHASLRREIRALRPHPVLGKWLHLAASGERFEEDARRLAALALSGDPRVGVEPRPRRPRGAAARAPRRLR